ncbi:MAG: DMT family transporter, partial [Myxococcaceae bacterium]
MLFYFLAPIAIGFMSVLQIALNKQVGQQYGLASVLMINALMILLAAGTLFLAVTYLPGRFGSFLAGSEVSFQFKLWHLLPGLFGFAVIAGLPYCMNQIGALAVFIIFVTAQVVGSMLWDNLVDGMPLTASKIVGAAI